MLAVIPSDFFHIQSHLTESSVLSTLSPSELSLSSVQLQSLSSHHLSHRILAVYWSLSVLHTLWAPEARLVSKLTPILSLASGGQKTHIRQVRVGKHVQGGSATVVSVPLWQHSTRSRCPQRTAHGGWTEAPTCKLAGLQKPKGCPSGPPEPHGHCQFQRPHPHSRTLVPDLHQALCFLHLQWTRAKITGRLSGSAKSGTRHLESGNKSGEAN